LANTDSPRSARFKGWYFDGVNNRLEYWFNGTKVGHINTSGMSITDDVTARMTDGLLQTAGEATAARQFFVRGTAAAIASNGANALVGINLFASKTIVIDSIWAVNLTASDVTTGTATSSASFRRVTLICNTAATGTGTDIIASLNATASAAAGASRGFTIAASTIPAGGLAQMSQLTVGAATADGTDAAAREYHIAYHYV